MGRERWYIALPGDCALLERAKKDPAFGEWLGWVTIFEQGGQRRPSSCDEIGDQFLAAVKQMNVEHPDIASRVFDLDRLYDAVHYLLSEARRRHEHYRDDWGTRAVCGTTELPDYLLPASGYPLGYSNPEEVQEIAQKIGTVTLADLGYNNDSFILQPFHPQRS